VVPEKSAERAYAILRDAMQKENKVGIATTVLGSKECLAALRVRDGEMLLSTMYFAGEVQRNPAKAIEIQSGDKELALAVSIIDGMTGKFDPRAYKDEYRERLTAAIGQKIEGKEITRPKEAEDIKIASLMDALTKSLELATKRPRVPSVRLPKSARRA
jgi:DNA end-binding protein Ku